MSYVMYDILQAIGPNSDVGATSCRARLMLTHGHARVHYVNTHTCVCIYIYIYIYICIYIYIERERYNLVTIAQTASSHARERVLQRTRRRGHAHVS